MSGRVPHLRPEFGDSADTIDPLTDRMKSAEPVSARDWSGLASAANWLHGRGSQVLPWTAWNVYINASGTTATTLRFRSMPATVARVWTLSMSAYPDGKAVGATGYSECTVTINGTAYPTSFVPTSGVARESFVFVEKLAAKPSAGWTTATVSVTAAAGVGLMGVHAVAAYDMPRLDLDLDGTDWGVSTVSLRARQPILDQDGISVAAVCDAEQHLGPTRNTLYAWAVGTADAITPGTAGNVNLIRLAVPCRNVIDDATTTTPLVKVSVYSKVSTGTGTVTFTSAQAGLDEVLSVTSTSFGWVEGELELESEDLTVSQGDRSGKETVTIEFANPTGGTIEVASVVIGRDGTDGRKV